VRVAYDVGKWSDFALAHVGASAALLGLVFVGLTINLREIVASGQLVHRALETVMLLAGVLATSTVVLIPGQVRAAVSAELIVLGAGLFAVVYFLQRDAAIQSVDASTGPPRSSVPARRAIGLGVPVLYAVAGLTLWATAGGGLYWWAPAVLLSYFGALVNAWILLVEILR
jgi:hypothetical protein